LSYCVASYFIIVQDIAAIASYVIDGPFMGSMLVRECASILYLGLITHFPLSYSKKYTSY